LQILDSHIPYEVFCGWYCLRNRNKANKGLKKQVFLLFRCPTSNSTNQSTLYWPYFYSLGNINHKKPHKVCGCLIFASISVQMQRYPLEDF
jgi:hypothetical protein